MYKRYAAAIFIAAISLAGCGGGAGGYGGSYNVPVVATAQPTLGNIPSQQTVAQSPAWVDSTTQKTLYFLDIDTASGSACTGSCLGLWPFLVANSSAQPQGDMTLITRSDGGGQQWAYQGHPLYFYAGDSAPGQSNGDGIAQDGGHWHVARPNASGNGGGTGGCSGPYC